MADFERPAQSAMDSPETLETVLESVEPGAMPEVTPRTAEPGDQISDQVPRQRDRWGAWAGSAILGFPGPNGALVETSESY